MSLIIVSKNKGIRIIIKFWRTKIEKEKNIDFKKVLDIFKAIMKKKAHKNIVLRPRLPLINHLFVQIKMRRKFSSQVPKLKFIFFNSFLIDDKYRLPKLNPIIFSNAGLPNIVIGNRAIIE